MHSPHFLFPSGLNEAGVNSQDEKLDAWLVDLCVPKEHLGRGPRACPFASASQSALPSAFTHHPCAPPWPSLALLAAPGEAGSPGHRPALFCLFPLFGERSAGSQSKEFFSSSTPQLLVWPPSTWLSLVLLLLSRKASTERVSSCAQLWRGRLRAGRPDSTMTKCRATSQAAAGIHDGGPGHSARALAP